MIDYHIHTHISGDCDVPMHDMAAAAQQQGLKEICFTEHIDLDFPCDIDFSVDFDAYRRAISAVQAAYPHITMRQGIEAGLDMRTKECMAQIIAAHDVDFVIGSLHLVFGEDPYEPEFWSKYDKRRIYDEYLRASVACAGACDFFDVMGHIGYISRFCPDDDKLLRYSDYSDEIDTLLKTLIHNGKGIEVNTNGLHKTPSTLPETAIINRYFELGGEIITVGSDAHFAKMVGYAIHPTLETLAQTGFKYVCAFDGRKPRFIPIS